MYFKKDLQKFDANVAKLIAIGNSGRRFPESRGPELRKFCKIANNWTTYLKPVLAVTQGLASSLYESIGCVTGALQGVPKCTPTALDSMLGLFRSITGNVVDVFCGDYTEGSDKCDSLDMSLTDSK
ncbi:unnamed protein product [Oppiella nova]|uniref:Uncharacterized protein n=1 Tax=Oppiella nova TaxID=334625 RepID=A0A7R9QET1_9ACAR|nr:unnamed protein product [Oppiella nova]CAG2163586.1 unnamed protein product [Oppiella nova]